MGDFMNVLITGGVVGVVCTGAFSIVQLFLNRRWQKQDREDENHKCIMDDIEHLKTKIAELRETLESYVYESERREAVNCRTRILRFADELVNEPGKKRTKGHFEQLLGDCTYYESYCNSHPNFKNQIAEQSIEIISEVYKNLCLTKGFM